MADIDFSTIEAAIVNVTIKSGDQQEFTIPLFDPNNNNAPVDLSVYSRFEAQIKIDSLRDSAVVTLKSDETTPEIVVGGASNNELTFKISKTKADQKRGVYKWDVKGEGGPLDPKTVVEGTFEFSQSTTKIVAP